jgi:hypothetical protein
MKTRLIPAILIGFLAFPIFSHFVHWGDHVFHIDVAMHMWRGDGMPPHPLFHACLLLLTAGENYLAAPGVVAFMLAAALGIRAWLTADQFVRAGTNSVFAATALCLALALALPLPNWWQGELYIGNVSPNTWHNPTGVFAMPFALATFLIGMRLIEEPSLRKALGAGPFLALSLLAKPNYLLAFGPYFGLGLTAALIRAVRKGMLTPLAAVGILLLTFGPPALVLAGQYKWLRQDTTILFVPWEVWNQFTHRHIPGSMLIGIAYPLAVLICFPGKVNSSPRLVAAWTTLVVGMATYALFAERGERLAHANFGWGMIYADQVLFIVSTAFLLRQPGRIRQVVCFAVLALHALSGIRCLVDIWKY